MTRRYLATTFSIAVTGALAIAACSTDDGGGATVCTEVTLYRFCALRLFDHMGAAIRREEPDSRGGTAEGR